MFGRGYFGSAFFGPTYFGPGVDLGGGATRTSGVSIGALAGGSAAAYISRRRGAQWVAIARIFLDDATENVGSRRVTHPSRVYQANVLRWGSIDRSIPLPSGMPQASRMKIRLADTDLAWRGKMGSQTPQGRRVQVKFLQAGTSEAAADILFTGLIDGFNAGPGYLEVNATSDMLAWLDEKLPEVITQANFPEASDVKQQYFPLILGHVVGLAVSIGYSSGAPAGPPSGALVDAADAAAALTAEIAGIVWSTINGPFSVYFIGPEWAAFQSKYNQALALIVNEIDLEWAAGELEYADAVYARTKLQDLLDTVDTKADEFAAISDGRASIEENFRSGVTAFFGEDWAQLLADVDAKITSTSTSPPEEAFAPQGAVKLPHIGFIDGVGDRWGASITPLWNALAIYRKGPGDAALTPVDPAEFNVTVQARSFGEYPDLTFQCTFIDFISLQPEGTEIHLDADGAYYRAAFGAMPAVGYAPGEGLTDTGPLRNPVDALLLMRELLFPKAGSASSFDVTALAALRVKLRDGGATVPALLCDAAITESMTARELLGRFNASFQTDFFETNRGLISMVRVDDTDELRPILPESVILRNTFEERSPETVNRFRAQYAYDYAADSWAALALADNVQDQTDRGKVEEQVMQLWFVRDRLTAQAAVYDRLRYSALGSYLQRFEVPLRSVSSFLDLARLIGITHRHGMLVSGYRNREVKIIGTSINLDGFRATIDSVVRSPLAFGNLRVSGFNAGALAGSAAQLTNRYRPTAHTFNDAPGAGIRGTWTGAANVYDRNPNTATVELLSGGTGGSTFSKLHLHNFQPFSTAGLVSVDVCVDMEYLHHGNVAFPGPLVDMRLFDGIDPIPSNPGIANIDSIVNPTADVPRAIHKVNVSAATWLGLGSPTVRLFQWNTAAIYSPDVEAQWFDCYIIPKY